MKDISSGSALYLNISVLVRRDKRVKEEYDLV